MLESKLKLKLKIKLEVGLKWKSLVPNSCMNR